MRRWVKPGLITLAVIAGVTALWWQMSVDQSTLRLDGVLYHISIMRTKAELEKGLSGTDSLAQGEAMLFVFPENTVPRMWMKDMKYPIDMVWLNDATQVVHAVENAQPSSYPKTIFVSPVPARYVIEFPAGTVEKVGIKNGDPVGLPSGVR
ncbi:MAG: DUF192 domain-containing protein [Candidatus Nomurabacteria bacterium]|nr:MAG: DUF192 domain-containing protein [Candidatus Nomurabacteria bacterium]